MHGRVYSLASQVKNGTLSVDSIAEPYRTELVNYLAMLEQTPKSTEVTENEDTD